MPLFTGPIIKKQSSNTFWSSSNLTHAQNMNVIRYRTGTLFNQKHAVRFNLSTDLTCPLCPHMDSALHMLSGCQHNMIRNMITERHNTASRHIVKALTNNIHGAIIAYTDIGSAAKLADKGVDTSDIANQTLPASWLLPGLLNQEMKACSRPDAVILLRRETPHSFRIHTTVIEHAEQLNKGRLMITPRRCDVHLKEFKYCEGTRPKPQLKKAQEQHAALVNSFRNQGYTTVTLHVV